MLLNPKIKEPEVLTTSRNEKLAETANQSHLRARSEFELNNMGLEKGEMCCRGCGGQKRAPGGINYVFFFN